MMKAFSKKARRQEGFTLVELLMSMALVGILGVTVFSSITFYFKNITVARQRLDRSRVVRTAIECFETTGNPVIPTADIPGYSVSILQDMTAAGLPGTLKAYDITVTKDGSADSFFYRFYWK